MGYLPEFHEIRFREDGLDGPPGELARVILHLRRDDSTALTRQLAPPIQRPSGALRLIVELVQRLDGEELVLAADIVLHDSVELRAHDEVQRLGVGVEGEVEAAVLVGFGSRGVGFLGGVVEGVFVVHFVFARFAFDDDLRREDVVDMCRFLFQRAGAVDLVFVAFAHFEGGVGRVLVDGHHVQGAAVALVDKNLVALFQHHDVPAVNAARGAHEHGEDVVGGEDGGFVFLRQLLDDGVRGGGDIVRRAVENGQLAHRGGRAGLFVEGAVVVIQEAVVIQVLAFARVEVELGEAVEVNLLQHAPAVLRLHRRLAVALRLVVVLPPESPSTSASASATWIVALLPASPADPLEGSSPAPLALLSPLASAAEDGTTPPAEPSTARRCL